MAATNHNGGGPTSGRALAVWSAEKIEAGDLVIIENLLGNTDYNGKRGLVLEPRPDERGKILVFHHTASIILHRTLANYWHVIVMRRPLHFALHSEEVSTVKNPGIVIINPFSQPSPTNRRQK